MVLENILFLRIAVFLLTLFFSYVVLDRIKVFHGGPAIVVSLVMSILAAYYVQEDLLQRWLVGWYQFLGISLLASFSFLVVFMIMMSFESSAVRKMIWIFYGVVLFFLMYQSPTPIPEYLFILFFAAILFVLVFDRWIFHLLERKRISTWLRRRR